MCSSEAHFLTCSYIHQVSRLIACLLYIRSIWIVYNKAGHYVLFLLSGTHSQNFVLQTNKTSDYIFSAVSVSCQSRNVISAQQKSCQFHPIAALGSSQNKWNHRSRVHRVGNNRFFVLFLCIPCRRLSPTNCTYSQSFGESSSFDTTHEQSFNDGCSS